MNSEFDNILEINLEDGSKAKIEVLDIIRTNVYNKTFIIYKFENDESNIFASILNEKSKTYSLDTITNEDEINYINSEINRVVSSSEGE